MLFATGLSIPVFHKPAVVRRKTMSFPETAFLCLIVALGLGKGGMEATAHFRG
jgi:hypothetical protein